MKRWDVEICRTVNDSLHVMIEADTAEAAEEEARVRNEVGDFDKEWLAGWPSEDCSYDAKED